MSVRLWAALAWLAVMLLLVNGFVEYAEGMAAR